MIGKRKAQAELFDVGNVFPYVLRPGTFHAQLAVYWKGKTWKTHTTLRVVKP